jgi:hypothetical protein
MDSLEDSVFGNVSGDILIAAGGAATIQANSVALATDTTGNYVADVTAGTGLTSTGATTGENISHSLSVDASQAQITTLAGATAIGTSGVPTTFAGTVNVDEAVTFDTTLGVTGVATLGDGSLLASSAAPSSDAMIANKKYVDDQLGASTLAFTTDSNGASNVSIDLDSETLSIIGTSSEIETSASADNTVKIGLPTNVDIAGDLTPVTFTMAEFTVDGYGNTDINGDMDVAGASSLAATGVLTNIRGTLSVDEAATLDTTLGVTGIATFTAQSVHTGGIESGGNIVSDTNSTDDLGTSAKRWANVYADNVSGSADEMIISADGDENSASGNTSDSLSLNAIGGIFTDDAVDMDSTLDVAGATSLAATGVLTNIRGTLNVDEAATLDTTLGVTGIATFTAQSVHSGGIDCNGEIDVLSDATFQSDVQVQGAAQLDTTLAVTGIGTFTAQSVHTGGLESGGNIVSDTDSTDDLGTSSKRWANVHHDAAVMEYAKKASFTKTMTGGADVAFTFDTANYKAVKIVCRVANGSDFTAKEVLIASDTDSGNLVEYGTVSTSTERDATFSVTYASGTCSVKCTGTASDVLNGTYELIA